MSNFDSLKQLVTNIHPRRESGHCILCGRYVTCNQMFDPIEILKMLKQHSNGFIYTTTYHAGVCLNGIRHKSTRLLSGMPQLILLDVVEKDDFYRDYTKILYRHINDIARGDFSKILSEENIRFNSVDDVFIDCDDLQNLFINARYKCAIVDDDCDGGIGHKDNEKPDNRPICGVLYEPGIPTIETVLSHIKIHIDSITNRRKKYPGFTEFIFAGRM